MKANDIQVGGEHYNRAGNCQHWDLVAAWRLGYFEGQVIKYVTRWRAKNGLEDLKKAQHFLLKMIELKAAGHLPVTLQGLHMAPAITPLQYAQANSLDEKGLEMQITKSVGVDKTLSACYHAQMLLTKLITAEYARLDAAAAQLSRNDILEEGSHPDSGYVNQG